MQMNGDHIGVVHNTSATMNPTLQGGEGGGGRGRREGLYAGERNGRKLERQFREVCYHHRDFICVQNMFDNHSLSKHSFDHHCFIIQV